jgi:hypothetical protein
MRQWPEIIISIALVLIILAAVLGLIGCQKILVKVGDTDDENKIECTGFFCGNPADGL